MGKCYLAKYSTYLLIGASLFVLGVIVGASLNARDEEAVLVHTLYPSIPSETPKEKAHRVDVEIKFLKPDLASMRASS